MSDFGVAELTVHMKGYDEIFATIGKDRYLDAIHNHWTSYAAPSLNEHNGLERVYLFARPEYTLARAIAAGISPDIVLRDWCKAIELMLADFSKLRRKSVLLEASSVIRVCGKEEFFGTPTIDFVLASLLVYQSAEIKPILAKLSASTLPLGDLDKPPVVDYGDILKQYCADREETNSFLDKNSRLLDQLQQEKSVKSTLTAELEQKKKYFKKFEVDHKKLCLASQAQKEENEVLLTQLHQVQEALERQHLHLAERDSENEMLAEQLQQEKAAQATLTVELEHNKKHLKQVDVDREKFCLVSKEWKEENELLLTQLHQVQEELEKYHLNLVERDSENEYLAEQHQQEKAEKLTLTSELEENKKTLKGLNDDHKKLGEDFNARKEESERLLLQHSQLQEKLENHHLRLAQRDSENETLAEQLKQEKTAKSALTAQLELKKNDYKQLEKAYKKLSTDSNEWKEENDLLLSQLHHVQEELEQYYLKIQEMDVTGDMLTSKIKLLSEKDMVDEYPASKKKSKVAQKISDVLCLRKNRALIRKDPIFDIEWYLREYPDIAAEKVDPLRHYLKFGADEGRNPGPDFNTKWYLQQYPDVSHSGINPLVHYIKYGKYEQRMKNERDWK